MWNAVAAVRKGPDSDSAVRITAVADVAASTRRGTTNSPTNTRMPPSTAAIAAVTATQRVKSATAARADVMPASTTTTAAQLFFAFLKAGVSRVVITAISNRR